MIPKRKQFILLLWGEHLIWSETEDLSNESIKIGRAFRHDLHTAKALYESFVARHADAAASCGSEMLPFERYTYSSDIRIVGLKAVIKLPTRKRTGGFRDCAGCGKFRIWIDEPPDLVKLHESGYCQNGEFKWFHSAVCLSDYTARNKDRYKKGKQGELL